LWPSREKLLRQAEHALFRSDADPKKIIAFFSYKQPVSGIGKFTLGGALLKRGRAAEGHRLIRQAWRETPLATSTEKLIKKKYAKVLRPKDHKARIDWLLIQNKKSNLDDVKRLLPLIDKKWEKQVKACIATVKRRKDAKKLVKKLGKNAKNNPATLLLRVHYARRADKDKKARKLLLSAPTASKDLIEPERWWSEREALIRSTLNSGDAKSAYKLAKHHPTDLEAHDISDAEFLAGWIALRFLKKPEVAEEHFSAAAAAGGLPYRRARAAYWAGRAKLERGNSKAASIYFAEAAQHFHTFYGQLAYQMISQGKAKLKPISYVRPTTHDIETFNKLDVMKAIVVAHKADMDSLIPIFLFDLARNLDNAPHMILTAELSQRISKPNITVRMAKLALNRGFPMEVYAYPKAVPKYKPLIKEQDLESALIHALTRQESEFNEKIVSSAGARGLMQLMPATAKEVARSVSVKYRKKKLIKDPSYNVSLGSAFLHQLQKQYDGSYIMTLAAYNAGPGRLRGWVKQFGDPRKSNVDPVDWVERIPIRETRRYVQKIMESIQIYRWRLNQEDTTLRLAQDLHRGRKDKPRFLPQMKAEN
jgi:soluble lytic murein transglycosylase